MSRLISAVAILIAAVVPSSEVARSSCPPDIPRAGFTDVYPLSTHAFDIDCLAWRSIVDDEGEFGPREPLARWEMAAWLDSALRWVQDRYEIPQTTFLDTFGVPSQESIEALRKLDVTLGVGDNRFDPYGTVPRWQMALFLTRTYSAAGFRLPLATDQGFVDIAGHTPAIQTAINQLAMLGITRGTGPATFSPDTPVTREQMASFASRLLEGIWVVQPVASSCDGATLPVRCTGSLVEVSPARDTALRVPMFMFDHLGDLDLASTVLMDPDTRIDLLIDGNPVPTTVSSHRSSGAVYRYWAGTIPAGTRGTVVVEARVSIGGVSTAVRTVSIEFR